MNITLFSTGCPQCQILESKLQDKGLDYTIINDIEKMKQLGMTRVPILQIDDGPLMDMSTANKWINNFGGINGEN